MASFLKDGNTSKADINSTVIAVLSSVGLIAIIAIISGFLIIRQRHTNTNQGTFLEAVAGPLKIKHSHSKSKLYYFERKHCYISLDEGRVDALNIFMGHVIT